MAKQVEIQLRPYPQGFHLVTTEIVKQLPELPQLGLLHLFIMHTSAALSINENADPTVRTDLNSFFNKHYPMEPYFNHDLEGDDDMPAHVKTTVVGTSVTIPITNGRLNLGTWQGIYLCEFRKHGGSRKIIATIIE